RGPFVGQETVERDPKRTGAERFATDHGAGHAHRRRADSRPERSDLRSGVGALDVELETTHRMREPLHGPVDSPPPDDPAHRGLRGRPELERGTAFEVS